MRQLLGILAAFLPATVAAEDVVGFRWLRSIDIPEIKATSVVSAPFDDHVYEQTRPGRPDLRLRNSRGELVGFVVRSASETKSHTTRSFWNAKQGTAKVDAETGLQVEFLLRDHEPLPTGVRIVTPLRDFEHQVRVESSANGTDWESDGPPAVIFDYSKYVDARNDLVPIEMNSHRRFRLTVADITAEQESQLMELHRRLDNGTETGRSERTVIAKRPFRIDRIEFYRDETKLETGRPKLATQPGLNVGIDELEKSRETVVHFETHRQPVTRVKLLTENENFSRTATVEAEVTDTHGRKTWRKLKSGTLTRFSVGTIQRDDVTLAIDETAAFVYRVVIENRDSPPLKITGVELSGPQYELVFLASPGEKLDLHYGSDDAERGQYDIAALQAALAEHQPVVAAMLQPPQADPLASQKPFRPWKAWNDTRLLLGAIIALTILLGWGLYRASREITPPAN